MSAPIPRRLLWLPALVVTAAAVLSAQAPQRDAPARQQSFGSGVISGTLVSDDANAKPLRNANVTLSGRGLPHSVMTTTDGEGRFTFLSLPAGSFMLSGEKPGYIEMDYGALRPNGDGLPIALESGEHATVTLKLPKGAAISGAVTTPTGDPIAGARMFIMRNNPTANGGHSIGPPGNVSGWHWQLSSDDRGVYRFYGLPAGDYYVVCQPNLEEKDIRVLGAADFDWARSLLQSAASGLNVPQAPLRSSVSFSSVLYPGTADVGGATPITVAAGEDRTGVDFPVPLVPTSNLDGIVRDPSGQPAEGTQINLIQPSVSLFLRGVPSARAGADGRFRISGVLPGAYTLTVRGAARAATAGAWARLDLNVDGRDLSNLDLSLQPGMTITGRVAFDGTAAPPADLKTVRVTLLPAGETVLFGSGSTAVSADGTFTVIGLSPGQYRLGGSAPRGPAGAASPWSLRATSAGGLDMFDHVFEMRPGQSLADVVVTFTDRTAEINGRLLDAAGKPAPQYFVVVFPTDSALWSTRSRRVKSVRPGVNGVYRIASLPAGEYFVAAVTRDADDLYTPAFLEPLIGASFKLTLSEGEKKNQDLQLKAGG